MPFILIAAVFAGLEVWSLRVGFGEIPMPPLLRLLLPLVVAASAVRFVGRERFGMITTATLLFAFLNREIVGGRMTATVVIFSCAGILTLIGVLTARTSHRLRIWDVAIAGLVVLIAFAFSLLVLTG